MAAATGPGLNNIMKIAELITPDRIRCDAEVSSKKRVLEQLSDLLTADDTTLAATQVFDRLVARERLGSTGLGHGVALPHARMEGIEQARGALIRLDRGVDFDAFDREPVDLLFALVVPEHFTDEHLQILADLAEMFSDSGLCEQLRATTDPTRLHQLLSEWQGSETAG